MRIPIIAVALTMVFGLVACGDTETGPEYGVIDIAVLNSAYCNKEKVNTSVVLYRPDGQDKRGRKWPLRAVCVHPTTIGSKYIPGGRYP